MYTYMAMVTRVVDGDTVHVLVDLGFDKFEAMTIRLEGIDAPEMSTQAGKDAKAALEDLLDHYGFKRGISADYGLSMTAGTQWVMLETVKDKKEKFGRYLGVLWDDGWDTNLNRLMVESGHAVYYRGGKR